MKDTLDAFDGRLTGMAIGAASLFLLGTVLALTSIGDFRAGARMEKAVRAYAGGQADSAAAWAREAQGIKAGYADAALMAWASTVQQRRMTPEEVQSVVHDCEALSSSLADDQLVSAAGIAACAESGTAAGLERSLVAVRELQNRFPRSADLCALAGAIDLRLGHGQTAKKMFQAALDPSQTDAPSPGCLASAYFGLANLQIQAGDAAGAAELLRSAAQVEPESPERIGKNLRYRRNQEARVREAFARLLAIDYASRSNDISRAEDLANRIPAIDWPDPSMARRFIGFTGVARWRLAMVQEPRGAENLRQTAARAWRKLLAPQENPEPAACANAVALSADHWETELADEQIPAAKFLSWCDRAARTPPALLGKNQDPLLHNRAAWRGYLGKDPHGAIAELKGMAERFPDRPELPRNLGVLAEKESDPEGALAWYRRSLALDPSQKDVTQRVAQLEKTKPAEGRPKQ